MAQGFESMVHMLRHDQVWVRARHVGNCAAAFRARGRGGRATRTRTLRYAAPLRSAATQDALSGSRPKCMHYRVAFCGLVAVLQGLPPQPLEALIASGTAALRMVAGMSG